MKILMFSSDPNISDKNSAAAKRMVEYGEMVKKLTIFVLVREEKEDIKLSDKVRVRVFSGRFRRFFDAFFAARAIFKLEKYDLIVAQDIEHASLAWKLSLWHKVPWQMQIHADIFSPYFWRQSFFNKLRVITAKILLPRAACIRVVSERIKQSILKAKSWKLKAITVLPIYVDVEKIKKTEQKFNLREVYPEFDFVILVAARLTKEKNVALAIEAMKDIVVKHPKAGLVIVGDGPERKNLEYRIKNYKLEDNVLLEGWQEDLISYYKSADCFLLTSNYEGYGMAVVEAMAAGLPIVMTNVGVAGELVKNGEGGFLVAVGNKEQVVEKIFALIQDMDLRLKIARQGQKQTENILTKEQYLKALKMSWQTCQK